MADYDAYIDANIDRWNDELDEFLRIPSISTDPAFAGDVVRCAEWLAGHLADAGVPDCEVIETAGHPIVVGERLVSADAPTLLIYGHYDVQPSEPDDLWTTPPFEPSRRDGRVYARGSVDDKGQVHMHVKALETWLSNGSGSGLNLKFVIEGEEEVGSAQLGPFLTDNTDRLACDAILISDTTMFSPTLPCITVGLRGIVYTEINVTGPAHDLHSGSYGGAVVNPANALASILAGLKDERGAATVPGFYDAVRPITDREKADLARLPMDEEAMRADVGATELGGEAGFTTLERLWYRPTLDVNGPPERLDRRRVQDRAPRQGDGEGLDAARPRPGSGYGGRGVRGAGSRADPGRRDGRGDALSRRRSVGRRPRPPRLRRGGRGPGGRIRFAAGDDPRGRVDPDHPDVRRDVRGAGAAGGVRAPGVERARARRVDRRGRVPQGRRRPREPLCGDRRAVAVGCGGGAGPSQRDPVGSAGAPVWPGGPATPTPPQVLQYRGGIMGRSSKESLSRREFVHLGAVGGAFLGVPALGAVPTLRSPGTGWLTAALEGAGRLLEPAEVAAAAAAWIRSHARETAAGLTWPRVPGEDEGGDVGLYHGSPGVILFLLELHGRTGDARALEDAARGASELVAVLESGSPIEPGLYSGLAGMAFTLDLTAASTGEPRFARAAEACVERIIETARDTGHGVAWYRDDVANASSDIVSGASGIGLTLLDYAARHDHAGAAEIAVAAARHLATLGEAAPGGLKWRMMPSFERLMPNFSHGTAGVATLLARAAAVSGDDRLLEAAIEGARYLEGIAVCDDGGCRVFHHEPEGEDLFYLSWCHGPAGTARLFYQLSETTGDPGWLEWVHRGARGIQSFGVPETRSPGYWNNISQCCGDCGVGEFFIALHAMTGDDAHLEYAGWIADYVQGRSDAAGSDGADTGGRDPEDPGAARRADLALTGSWTQAEHRVRPELLEAQTGWMQGAAGVGAFFLHLDARRAGESPLVTLPDTPWAAAL